MKNFLSVHDVDSIDYLIRRGQHHKRNPFEANETGRHKTLINLFFNPSLRTRLSTEKAGYQLGFQVITMDMAGGWKLEFEDGAVMNLDRAEHVKEAAGVLSQYCDILAVRSFPGLEDREADYEDRIINAFRKYATVPVVSLESAIRHPLQSLADCITISERATMARPRVVLTWAPHPRKLPQAVGNSFAEWMVAWGAVDLVIANPEGFDLGAGIHPGGRSGTRPGKQPWTGRTSCTRRTGRPTRTTEIRPTCLIGRLPPSAWPSPTRPTSCTACRCAAT